MSVHQALLFLGGMMSGATIGVLTMAAVTLAKEADRRSGISDGEIH